MTALEQVRELATKFYSRIIPEPMSGCYLWLGSISIYGYPVLTTSRKYGKQKIIRAHRKGQQKKKMLKLLLEK